MKTFTVTVKEKSKIGDDLHLLRFDYSGTAFTFAPGQYAHFTIGSPKFQDEKGNTRPLSIANAPNEKNEILILTRAGESAFAKNLVLLQPGDELQISEPKGSASLPDDNDIPVVFIAGGTGIAPVRSLLEHDIARGNKRKIRLFYAVRSFAHTAFESDLALWQKQNPNLNTVYIIQEDEQSSQLNMELLEGNNAVDEDFYYYIFGPPSLVNSMVDLLDKAGVHSGKIVYERFSAN